jgi:serine/threonine protein kinase
LYDIIVTSSACIFLFAFIFSFFHPRHDSLLYRDIKPENIGFDKRGDVKVFDFGLMKSLE